mgnify:CR=1 FL=1
MSAVDPRWALVVRLRGAVKARLVDSREMGRVWWSFPSLVMLYGRLSLRCCQQLALARGHPDAVSHVKALGPLFILRNKLIPFTIIGLD